MSHAGLDTPIATGFVQKFSNLGIDGEGGKGGGGVASEVRIGYPYPLNHIK